MATTVKMILEQKALTTLQRIEAARARWPSDGVLLLQRPANWRCMPRRSIIYLRTTQGWLDLIVVIDLCTGKVICWASSQGIDAQLACVALKAGIPRRSLPCGQSCTPTVAVDTAAGSTVI